MTILPLLQQTKIRDITPKTGDFITVQATDSVKDALQILIKNQIFSAPVQNSKKQYIGILSALDIMTYIIDLFGEDDEESKGKSIYDVISTNNSKYESSTVSHVLDHCMETSEPYESVSSDISVFEAMEVFAKGLHRLVVVDENENPIGFLTQSAVITFLSKNMDILGGKKIGELDIGTRSCIVVGKDSRTIDAFAILRQRQISGVGVVDSRGALIGNISSRDLNALGSDNLYEIMFLPVGAFISSMKSLLINEDQPIISVTEESKLGYVVNRMACNRIHRIYITDSHQKPIGVIAMRDVIRCVLAELKSEQL